MPFDRGHLNIYLDMEKFPAGNEIASLLQKKKLFKIEVFLLKIVVSFWYCSEKNTSKTFIAINYLIQVTHR